MGENISLSSLDFLLFAASIRFELSIKLYQGFGDILAATWDPRFRLNQQDNISNNHKGIIFAIQRGFSSSLSDVCAIFLYIFIWRKISNIQPINHKLLAQLEMMRLNERKPQKLEAKKIFEPNTKKCFFFLFSVFMFICGLNYVVCHVFRYHHRRLHHRNAAMLFIFFRDGKLNRINVKLFLDSQESELLIY